MPIPDFNKIVDEVKAMPEVTQGQAMEHFLSLTNSHEAECEKLTAILSEIVGFAITNGDAEMTRRFVVWQCFNGPIMRGSR